MTAESLALYAGAFLSLLFTYVPGLNKKYDALDPTYKRLVMLGALFLVAAVSYGLSCAKVYDIVTCDRTGLLKLVELFVSALVANQATFLISPKPAS